MWLLESHFDDVVGDVDGKIVGDDVSDVDLMPLTTNLDYHLMNEEVMVT